MAHSWTCLYCNRPTTLTDNDLSQHNYRLFENSKYGKVGIGWNAARCPNPGCAEISLYVSFEKRGEFVVSGELKHIIPLESWILRPESNAKPQPDYLPTAIKEDYYEAYLILEKSPKASATLSRRCLQGMIRNFWGIKKKNLFAEISELEKHVDPNTWKSIDAVREVGNIGAHMEKDIDHIVPVEPEEAQLLIGMIEQLIDDWYVQRYEREQRTKSIIEMAEEKKKLKNQAPESADSQTDSQ